MFNFLFSQLAKTQMKGLPAQAGVPEADKQKIVSMIQKNPNLFKEIFAHVQEEVKKGKDTNTASMEAVKKYEAELRNAIK